jgi:hypothetical protein
LARQDKDAKSQITQEDEDSEEWNILEDSDGDEQEAIEALHAASLASDYVDNLPVLDDPETDDSPPHNVFTIDPALLYAATLVTSLSNVGKGPTSTVEIYPNFLRVSSSKDAVIYRADAALSDHLDGLHQKVAFDICNKQLKVICRFGGCEPYDFKFLPHEGRLVHFVTNRSKRMTSTQTVQPSDEPSKLLREISLITYPPSRLSGSLQGGDGIAFDSAALLRALKYVRPSCAPNRDEPQKAGIMVSEGRAMGGQPKAFSFYEEPGLTDINLHIPHNHIDHVQRALRRLKPSQTRLFKSGATYIISDGVIHCEITSEPLAYKGMVLGIEKFMEQANDHVVASRRDLLEGVRGCASIIPKEKASAHTRENAPDISLEMQESGESFGLRLSTAYRSGRYTAQCLVDVRQASGGPEIKTTSLRVDLTTFQSALEHYEGKLDEVHIYMQHERGLLIENVGETFRAKTLLWGKKQMTGRI